MAAVDVGFTDILGLQVRGVYSAFRSNWTHFTNFQDVGMVVDNYGFQAVPYIRLRTPLDWLDLKPGIGLGYYHSYTRDRETEYSGYPTADIRELERWQGIQTFVLAILARPVRHLALEFELERTGCGFGWNEDRLYHEYGWEGEWHVVSSELELFFGWHPVSLTGVGVGVYYEF